MMRPWLLLALAGCAIGDTSPGVDTPPGAPPPATDPPPACMLDLQFDPPFPIAAPTTVVRVTATVVGSTAPLESLVWGLARDGASLPFTDATGGAAAIEIHADSPGIYTIAVSAEINGLSCFSGTRALNVSAPGAKVEYVRLRVVPPAGLGAPMIEQPIMIDGGADSDLGVVVLPRGVNVGVHVRGPGGGEPAYVRFSPNGARDAVIEAFADATGLVETTLPSDYHSVLVVPGPGGGAPRRVLNWWALGPTDLAVDAGTTITGTVRDPDSAALANATVQLSIDGVPSTVAKTDAAGGFALQAAPGSGPVTLTVTPPAGSGLPRLTATAAFDLGQPLQVRYAVNLARRSLAGLRIERGGAPVAGAQVMVVGTLSAIGSVAAGVTATATGDVRIAVKASGAGTLPAEQVPAAQLSAVITAAPGDLAVAALDTTTAVPARLDAPAPQVIATGARGGDSAMLPGAVLDLVPTGALAMAMAAPLHLVADANGAFTAALAAGGHYDLRFLDPAGRAAPRVVTDLTAPAIDRGGYALPAAITIRGGLLLAGRQALANASVQILCGTCTGVDRVKPIAEAMSDDAGRFTLAVPDPGTM